MGDDDVRHIHPVHYEHINPFGHYRFDTRRGPAKGRLRPLRAATYIPRAAATTNATATNAWRCRNTLRRTHDPEVKAPANQPKPTVRLVERGASSDG